MAGVGCVAALGASTLTAGAQTGEEPEVDEVRGYAAGLYLSAMSDELGGDVEIGPTPEVTLPPEGGGPFSESLPLLVHELGETDVEFGTDVVVSTEGALGVDGYASSSVTIENVLQDPGLLLAVADLLEVECSSDIADGPVGSTTILGGSVVHPVTEETVEIDESPEPNTVIADFEFDANDEGFFGPGSIRVVANEQIVDGDDITVIGLHISVSLTFTENGVVEEESLELVLGEVSCGIDVVEPLTPDEPTATTTTVPADDVEPPAETVAVAVATPRFTG